MSTAPAPEEVKVHIIEVLYPNAGLLAHKVI